MVGGKAGTGRAQTHRPATTRTRRRAPNPRPAAPAGGIGSESPAGSRGLDVPGAVVGDRPYVGGNGWVLAGEETD